MTLTCQRSFAGLALALMLAAASTFAAHARGMMANAPMHGAGGAGGPVTMVICADGALVEITLNPSDESPEPPAGTHTHCLDCTLCFAAGPEPAATRPHPVERGARVRPHAARRRVLRRLNPRRARDPPEPGALQTR